MNAVALARAITSELRQSGLRGTFKRILLMKGEIREGICVGEDAWGNKYYQSPSRSTEQAWRDRWVEYTYVDGKNVDSSTVPAEWHRWLHHMVDEAPTQKEVPQPAFALKSPERNWTGTGNAYTSPGFKASNYRMNPNYRPYQQQVEWWNPTQTSSK
eukprot:tig00021494_g21921.t1